MHTPKQVNIASNLEIMSSIFHTHTHTPHKVLAKRHRGSVNETNTQKRPPHTMSVTNECVYNIHY